MLQAPARRTVALSKYPTGMSVHALAASPKLSLAFLRMNNICNAKCEFCDVWKTPQVDADARIDMLALWRDLEQLNPSEVNVHGGEAFLSRDFFNILDINAKTPISITTNGTALSPKLLARIRSHGSFLKKFYVSIDHVDPLRNADSRGIRWLNSNLYPALRYLKQQIDDTIIIVNHVVSALNYDSIDRLLLAMRDVGVDSVNLIPIKDYPSLYLRPDQITTCMQKIDTLLAQGHIDRDLFMDGNYQIFGSSAQDYVRASQGVYNGATKSACAIPATSLFIDAVTGNVYPCDTTMYRPDPEQYVMGNVREQSLQAIWTGAKFNAFRARMYPAITCECINGCDPANSLR